MTVTELLQAHGLSTQDEADALLLRLHRDRAVLLAACKESSERLREHGYRDTEGGTLHQVVAAIAQAEAK